MEEFKDYFKVKKNLLNLLILGILILALPLGINLVRTQQILRSRAVGDPVVFTGANVVTRNGQLIALAPQVSIQLTSTLGDPSPVMNPPGIVNNNAGQGAPMSLLPQGLVQTAYAATGSRLYMSEGFVTGSPQTTTVQSGTPTLLTAETTKDCANNIVDMQNSNFSGVGLSCQAARKLTCSEPRPPYDCWFEWECYAGPPGSYQATFGDVDAQKQIIDNACKTTRTYTVTGGNGGKTHVYVDPNPVQVGANVTVTATAPADCATNIANMGNQGFSGAGLNCGAVNKDARNGPNPKDGNPWWWQWPCTAVAAGAFTANFSASGPNCQSSTSYTVTGGPTPPPSGNLCPITCHELTKCDPTCDSTKGEYCSADYRQCAGGTPQKTFNPCEKAAGPKSCATTPPVTKDDSGPGTDCNVNVPYNAANKPLYDLWDGKCDSTNVKLQAAGSGIGQLCCEKACGADAACDEQFAGQGNCDANCKVKLPPPPSSPSSPSSPSPSGTPRSSPSYPPATVFTIQYRMAESATDLNNAVWQGYFSAPTTVAYTFKDITPGIKTIFVQFKDTNGHTGCGSGQSCSASIKLVGSEPVISRCFVSSEGSNTVLNLTGTNFGSTNGTVKSDQTPLSVRQWNNTSVTAVWQNAPSGQVLPVTLTNSDGQTADGQCSATSMLSFGAKYICRTTSSKGIDNVDLTLIGKFEGGKKVKQKVKIDAQGIVSGITEKLEDGKQYILSIKAPLSLKKNSTIFTAGGGITNIPNFVLPVGDIFPADEGDGTINSLDKAELNRQWIISGSSGVRSGDFNGDGRVNSVDWACMRYGFGRVDDPEEEPGGPPAPSASPNPNVSASPSTSGSPSASASPGSPEASFSPNPSPTNCVPRPSCLDATPRCLIVEPIEGWCQSRTAPSASPIPSASPSENPWPSPSSGGWRGWWQW